MVPRFGSCSEQIQVRRKDILPKEKDEQKMGGEEEETMNVGMSYKPYSWRKVLG